jgi:hypothetical protein
MQSDETRPMSAFVSPDDVGPLLAMIAATFSVRGYVSVSNL